MKIVIHIGILTVLGSALSVPSVQAAPYTITDLGTSSETFDSSFAADINNFGQIVGSVSDSVHNIQRPFVYTNGVMTVLGSLGGDTSYASAINNLGQVVGTSTFAQVPNDIFRYHGFLFSNGAMTDLGTLGGHSSRAFDINDNGQIVGSADRDNYVTQAFVYTNGVMSTIPGLASSSIAYAINNADQIVGHGPFNAFSYFNGAVTDLGPVVGDYSSSFGINNLGQIVGNGVHSNFLFHAFSYINGTATDLGTLTGDTASTAWAVNDSGQIVGYSYHDAPGATIYTAFVSQYSAIVDLNTQINPNLGWNLTEAHSINASGQIVGVGFHGGQSHAFLLTPNVATPGVPKAPSFAVASAVSPNQADVRWGVVPNATSYWIFRSTTPGGYHSYVGMTMDTANFQDPGLLPSTKYYYVVLGVNSSGAGAKSIEAAVTTKPPYPAAPTNVVATALNVAQIALTWNPVATADRYDVFRATTPNGYHGYVGSTSTTSLTDTYLAPNTHYYYVVKAINGSGPGARSAEVDAVTRAVPSPPTHITASAHNAVQIDLKWQAALGATSYSIYRITLGGGPFTYAGSSISTSFNDVGLKPATTYHYVVVSVNAIGSGPNSDEVTAATNALPSPPTYLLATPISTSEIQLVWDGAAGATSYLVFRGTSAGGYHAYIGTTANKYFHDTGLHSATRYYYIVVPANSYGQGAKSLEFSTKTL